MFKILITISLLLILGCGDGKTKQTTESDSLTTTNKIASNIDKNESMGEIPLFTLDTVDGKQLNISEIENGLKFKELKNKAIFLIFFGYRCPPCVREIPLLIELTKKYDDLAIVAVEVQGYDSQELKAFGERRGINYTLLSSDDNMDFVSYVQAKSKWHGSIPFLLGIHKNGKVKIIHTGGLGKSSLEGAYQDLINIK